MRHFLLVSILSLGLGCGDTSLTKYGPECGDGTREEGGICVPIATDTGSTTATGTTDGEATGGGATDVGDTATGGETNGGEATSGETTGTEDTGTIDTGTGVEETGSPDTGATAGGETMGSDTVGDETTGGDTTGGDATSDDTTGGDTSGGAATSDDTTGGDTTGSDSSSGDTTSGDTTGGESGGTTGSAAPDDGICAGAGPGLSRYTSPDAYSPEIHIVSVYEPHPTDSEIVIENTRPNIALVLSSYVPARWRVENVDGGSISTIAITGHGRASHTVSGDGTTGVPTTVESFGACSYEWPTTTSGTWVPGTEISVGWGDGYDWYEGGCSTPGLVDAAMTHFGTTIQSWQGCYGGNHFVVE